ncbi:YraN family protein [Chloroflexota bacterium]
MNSKQTGDLGEKLAREYLKARGYRIITTNYYCQEGEVDIIARHGENLVFVEVRTRRSAEYGSAAESITDVKKGRLRLSAQRYLQEMEYEECPCRIDAVLVTFTDSRSIPLIEHIENAVEGE